MKGFALIELMIVVAIMGVLSAISIPVYYEHVIKTQVVRVMREAGEKRLDIEICIHEGRGVLGKGIQECHFEWINSSNLLSGFGFPKRPVSGEILNENVNIVVEFGGDASQVLQGRELKWERNKNGNWTCKTNVDNKYRPSGCQADI